MLFLWIAPVWHERGEREGEQQSVSSRRKGPSSESTFIPGVTTHTMKAEYDLAKMKSRRNPYAAKLKKPVRMRLSEDVIAYFKAMAEETGVPYQSLINLYLRDCVAHHRKVEIS